MARSRTTKTASESKNFHTSDGLGLRAAMQAGLKVVVVTARSSKLVERRMTQLGVDRLVQGCKDKRSRVAELAVEFGVPLAACGYLGDDLVDLGAMDTVGYPMAVARCGGRTAGDVGLSCAHSPAAAAPPARRWSTC